MSTHLWIGAFLFVGGGSHVGIFFIFWYSSSYSKHSTFLNSLMQIWLIQRDLLIGHLCWVCIFLGFHSFGLYIHNDFMLSLGRPDDMFSDERKYSA